MESRARRVTPRCPDPACHGASGSRSVIKHSRLRSKHRLQRRFLCRACGKTFAASAGTPYHRLRSSKEDFDRVVALSLEGMSKAGIARVTGRSWNTVARWLERAAAHAHRFQEKHVRKVEAVEMQLDELRTSVGDKSKPSWIQAHLQVQARYQ